MYLKNNNLSKNYIVSKSRPLLSLSKSELSLYELKVLDTYLSRINSRNPDERTVIFDKGEFEALFDYADIDLTAMKVHLNNLQSLKVDISTSERETDNIVLFERAKAVQDQYKMWQVELTCSQSAMKYFFNIENLGYLRYKLLHILQLKSRYSYFLFLYLVDNRFRKEWIISLDELKSFLNCDQRESYSEYKNFRRFVLDKARKEILDKTDIIFDFKTIKRGRYVKEIQFKVQTWGELAAIKAEIEEHPQQTIEVNHQNSDIDIMLELSDNTISRENMQVIYDLILKLNVSKGEYGTGRVDYFKYRYDRMLIAETKTPIRDRGAYIRGMLTKQIKGDE